MHEHAGKEGVVNVNFFFIIIIAMYFPAVRMHVCEFQCVCNGMSGFGTHTLPPSPTRHTTHSRVVTMLLLMRLSSSRAML